MIRRHLCIAVAVAGGCAAAQAQAVDVAAAAVRCEAEVGATLLRLHGKSVQGTRFDAGRRQLFAGGEGDDVLVRGEGRYQVGAGAARDFDYSCAYNPRTGATAGVVLRQHDDADAGEREWEPDLARVSPEACESATAVLLKDRNPRVLRIAFDPATRRLEPTADSVHVGLAGRGAMQRAPGMPELKFSYRCELDTRDGRVVAVQARE
jgi:hypothetical protein